MFTIKDRAISPLKGHFTEVLTRLPEAHAAAHDAGMEHLHGATTTAAEESGLPTSPIKISGDRIVIDHSPEGDRVADHEFGLPGTAPNPVLRSAHRAAHDGAQGVYTETLSRLAGL